MSSPGSFGVSEELPSSILSPSKPKNTAKISDIFRFARAVGIAPPLARGGVGESCFYF